MTSQKDLRNILKELLELDSGLNNWEIEFLESLSHWSGDFTPKQAAMLEKICEKYL